MSKKTEEGVLTYDTLKAAIDKVASHSTGITPIEPMLAKSNNYLRFILAYTREDLSVAYEELIKFRQLGVIGRMLKDIPDSRESEIINEINKLEKKLAEYKERLEEDKHDR